MSDKPQPQSATVIEIGDLCPGMARVRLHASDLDHETTASDHYVKLILPADSGPVRRSVTVRDWDPERHELTLNIVTHGGGPLGDWLATARPGDAIDFQGPGRTWGPTPEMTRLLLVGDEAASAAIARTIELAAPGTQIDAYLEVADAAHQMPMPPGARVHWVHRADRHTEAAPGLALVEAVRAYALPADPTGFAAFVHGNADMIRDVRRWLFVDHDIPRDQVSISGYWRFGHTDETWRAHKKQFNAQLEAEEAR